MQFNHIFCSLKILQVFRVKVLTEFTLKKLAGSSYDLILTPLRFILKDMREVDLIEKKG